MTSSPYNTVFLIVAIVAVALVWRSLFPHSSRKAKNILNYVIVASFVGLLINSFFLAPWDFLVAIAATIATGYYAVTSGWFKGTNLTGVGIVIGLGVFAGYVLFNVFGTITGGWSNIASIVYVVIGYVVIAQNLLKDVKIPGIDDEEKKSKK